MLNIRMIKSLLVLGLFVSGLALTACSGKKKANEGSDEGQDKTTMEKESKGNQQEPPSFDQGQNTGSDTVSPEKLKQFKGAMDANRAIQQNMRAEMQEAVKDAGLSMEEYRQINQKQRGSGRGMQGNQQSSKLSDEERKKLNKANENLKPLRQEMREKMEGAIKEEGMTMQEYQRILGKIRQDRSLQQRLQQLGQSGNQTRQQAPQ